MWIAWRQLALEAERACDDAVLRRADATAYADQLVVLAERLSIAQKVPLLAMANREDLATRVGAVLDNRQQRGRAGAIAVTSACAASALLVVTISPLQIVAAYTPIAAQSAPGPKFDVASIKRCDPQAEPEAPAGRGQRGAGPGGGRFTASPGSVSIDCTNLETLIQIAYVRFGEPLLNDFGASRDDSPRIKGVPSWGRSEKHAIEAKAEGTPDRAVMMGPMLRALVEERFRVKLHRDVEEVPVYLLTVAKGGFRVKPMAEGGCIEFDPANPPPRPANPNDSAFRIDGKPVCGSVRRGRNGSMRTWDLGGYEVGTFVQLLNLDRRVIDRSGVTGRFNLHLEYAPDEHTPDDARALSLVSDAIAADPSDPAGPTIFRALEQQLGLKLEPGKGPHGFIVVDHAERPSPNGAAVIR